MFGFPHESNRRNQDSLPIHYSLLSCALPETSSTFTARPCIYTLFTQNIPDVSMPFCHSASQPSLIPQLFSRLAFYSLLQPTSSANTRLAAPSSRELRLQNIQNVHWSKRVLHLPLPKHVLPQEGRCSSQKHHLRACGQDRGRHDCMGDM